MQTIFKQHIIFIRTIDNTVVVQSALIYTIIRIKYFNS